LRQKDRKPVNILPVKEYNNCAAESVLRIIASLDVPRVLIAVDGRCASGKTTLAAGLQQALGGNIVHMDHFFLPPDLRTPKRLADPGGNIDYVRFLGEVLGPLASGLPCSYRPFNCKTGQFGEPIEIAPNRVNIIEGSYSCHPFFAESYDLKIFLDIGADEQQRRIKRRNGKAAAKNFAQKWIPLEERYFAHYKIRESCDIVLT